MGRTVGGGTRGLAKWAGVTGAAVLFATLVAGGGQAVGAQRATGVRPNAVGNLDCNGFSPIQRPIKPTQACSDPKGYEGGRFYDNGHYVGHDEPIVRFMSDRQGTGNDVTWNETLPLDPNPLPTVANPGSDVTHWFELSIAPWFSMALCNPESYPLTPCTPNSDSNAPKNFLNPGGGSSFLEMQFYPPGFGPFIDSISCDNTHWCASLHINDLECTNGFESCNPNCIEPTNFAFIQTDGVPTGPPSPQLADVATDTPNAQTLLMSPGDKLAIRIFDADIGNGNHALETRINDLTTGQTGYMIASARNGFMATNPQDCSGTPFNYEPEFDTARPQNVVSWAALEVNIASQFEIGHFTPCTSISDVRRLAIGSFTDRMWLRCSGPYEAADGDDSTSEGTDAPCYFRGDTHRGTSPPDEVTGCANFFGTGGEVDFDGTSYWSDWPNDLAPGPFPSPFLQQPPTSHGGDYGQLQFQTDAPASESTCRPYPNSTVGCAVPPPGAPGHFYPYWTFASVGGECVWEFGKMPNGNTFGGDAQYGAPSAWFFGTLESAIMDNPKTC